MRKIIIILLLSCCILSCDKPDALKKEAYLIVENNSSMYNITEVYYANSGIGSNRLSSNLEPGESKTFKLNAEDNYIYNLFLTSDNPNVDDYSFDEVHFYDDREITIILTDTEWDDYYPW